MNTEQQLRERAEGMLDETMAKYPKEATKGYSYLKNWIIDFAIDFHNQELKRIGEVVYVPVSEVELLKQEGKPVPCSWLWCNKALWLKKLSLLEVKDLEDK